MPQNCLADVPAKFETIPPKVKAGFYSALLSYISFLWFKFSQMVALFLPSLKPDFPHDSLNKRYLGAHRGILDGYQGSTSSVKAHFQGIQRIGQHVIVSGGLTIHSRGGPRSQLIIIEMGSQQENGPWSLPVYKPGYSHADPHPDDTVIKVKNIDECKWHAGGIQAAGDIIAVPIYGDGKGSEVRFFKFTPPCHLEEICEARVTLKSAQAKAVGLVQPDKVYFLMIWDDEHLMFYRSKSGDLKQGFEGPIYKVRGKDYEDFQKGGGDATYQNVNLLYDTQFKGEVYFVATRNTKSYHPLGLGKDYADLFQVIWPENDARNLEIKLIDHRQMYCYDRQCHFAAGAGVYVDNKTHLYLYACYFWLHQKMHMYKFNGYANENALGD